MQKDKDINGLGFNDDGGKRTPKKDKNKARETQNDEAAGKRK